MRAVEAGIGSEQHGEQEIWREMATLAVIGVALLCGVAFRWFDLARWGLWWDEGFTVWAARLSPAQIISFAKSDHHAPLYYLMEHGWTTLFGNSEFALRSLSALFGTLALPVFYLLSKRVLQGAMATALAVWLFAFSMTQIWYSREARAYEAASFFALVALYALMLFLEKRSAWLFLVIVLSSALTLYLHGMMFFYLLAFDLVWLAYPSERTPARRIGEILLANLCIGLLYLPWASSLLTQVAIGEALSWVTRPSFGKLVRTLRDTAGFEAAYLSDFAKKFLPLSERARSYAIFSAGVLLCGGVLAGSFWGVSRNERRKNVCFLLYGLLPIFLVFLLGQRTPLYLNDGVFLPSSSVFPIIFAFPLAATKRFTARFLAGILGIILACTMALSGFGFIRYGEELVRNREDWRGATAALLTLRDESLGPVPGFNRLFVFLPPAGEILFDYYAKYFPAADARVARTGLPADFYDRFPPPKAKTTDADDVGMLRRLLKAGKYSEVDLVLTHDADPQGLIVHYLDQDFIRQDEPELSGPGVRIIPFHALPRPEPAAERHPPENCCGSSSRSTSGSANGATKTSSDLR